MCIRDRLNLANELQGATDNTDMLESVSDSIVDMKARIEKVLNDKPQALEPISQAQLL